MKGFSKKFFTCSADICIGVLKITQLTLSVKKKIIKEIVLFLSHKH
jgi:hypothetical protein